MIITILVSCSYTNQQKENRKRRKTKQILGVGVKWVDKYIILTLNVSYLKHSWMLYLLKLAVSLRLCCDPQQLFFMFLDLFLETHVLLTNHSLQFLQLKTKAQEFI